MKDVERVTGYMGEGEAMTPAEEAAGVATEAASVPKANAETEVGTGGTAIPDAPSEASPGPATRNASDLWQALTQFGVRLLAALEAAGHPAAPHPWIERDPGTGAQSLKLPLPPETAGKIADGLSMLANTLRGQRP